MYISVKYDSRGIFRFDTMKNEPKLYRKYQAYIIGSVPNTTVQLHVEGSIYCAPLIEVSKRICHAFYDKFSTSCDPQQITGILTSLFRISDMLLPFKIRLALTDKSLHFLPI